MIIIGDALEKIKDMPDDSFDAILFDPFSPSVHKELWSLNVFKECHVRFSLSITFSVYFIKLV